MVDNSLNNFPDILTVNDLAASLHICRSMAYKLVRTGAVRSIHIGNKIRIPKAYLLDFIYSDRQKNDII
jgi:excisionase family DNA binding protein